MIVASEFENYSRMRHQGVGPKQVYHAGKSDGLDEITLIRMIRAVFDLTLADAKRAIGAGASFEAKQTIQVGSTVHWVGSDSSGDYAIMEGRVIEIVGSLARLDNIRSYRRSAATPTEEAGDREFQVAYLERSLIEQLEDSEDFWKELALDQ